jgi:hypothetical protein
MMTLYENHGLVVGLEISGKQPETPPGARMTLDNAKNVP